MQRVIIMKYVLFAVIMLCLPLVAGAARAAKIDQVRVQKQGEECTKEASKTGKLSDKCLKFRNDLQAQNLNIYCDVLVKGWCYSNYKSCQRDPFSTKTHCVEEYKQCFKWWKCPEPPDPTAGQGSDNAK